MKKNKQYMLSGALLTLCALLLAPSCSQEPYLSVPDVQREFAFESGGGTKFASIRSHGSFTAESDCEWCYVEVYDHANNNLRISVPENDVAKIRTATITLSADGTAPQTITVSQAASVAYIRPLTESVLLSAETLRFSITVAANTLYDMSLPDWVSHEGDFEPRTGEATYSFNVEEIPVNLAERSGNITLTARDDAALTAVIPVTQTHEVLPIIDEHFDWANATSDTPGSTAGEIRFDQLQTNTAGWTTETVSGNVNVWARAGCLRFSRTAQGGILVSPPFTAINGSADVTVSFKAARWNGADTAHIFTIVVRNAGEASQTRFEITNRDEGVWQENPECVYTFDITGATAETRIVFISADNTTGDLGAGVVGRLLLDDVKVEYK